MLEEQRGCLKSTPSLGLLSDNFCHLGDSQSINLPFETASLCLFIPELQKAIARQISVR